MKKKKKNTAICFSIKDKNRLIKKKPMIPFI